MSTLQCWSRPDGAGGVYRTELLVDEQGGVLISAALLGEMLTALGWSPVDDDAGEKREFRVTFGQKYAHTTHPLFTDAHPDGWVTILAADERAARSLALMCFGRAWSNLYSLEESTDMWGPSVFPRGELLRLEDFSDAQAKLGRQLQPSRVLA